MKNLFFLFCLVIFLGSCKVQPVTISKIGSVKMTSLSEKGVTYEITMKINNPNSMGVTIYKSPLNIKLNETDLGTTGLKKKIRIKPRSEIDYTIVMQSDLSKIGSVVSLALTQIMGQGKGKNVTISVKGDLKAGKFFYKKKFPIEFKEKISLTK